MLVLRIFLSLFSLLPALSLAAQLILPKTGIGPDELAVIVNLNDPLSVKIAEYYRSKRGIPERNLISVRLPPKSPNLPKETFEAIRASVLERLNPNIQALALAWTYPYRVDCMSITSAFAFGFDPAYCSAKQCANTKPSAYFNTSSSSPHSDFQLWPAILLAGESFDEVKKLIDRGVASDQTFPDRTGYLLNTSDKSRSVRAAFFDLTLQSLGSAFHLVKLDADYIEGKQDVLFYFTGMTKVDKLKTLRFVPGALADHLTSAGGVLEVESQMSSLRWLEAGATGSYGTVVEPCNHLQKFPVPAVVMWHYAQGNSLIEAYWKSVATPGEGVFIGEPLAKPYAPRLVREDQSLAVVEWFSPSERMIRLESAQSWVGPFFPVQVYRLHPGLNRLELHLPDADKAYRIAL